MSAPTYAQPIVGINAAVEVGVPNTDGTAATTFILIKNSNYEIKPVGNNKEAPNTSDGMLRAPGLRDYTITLKGHTDVSNAGANAPENNLMPGSILDFRAYRSYTGANATGGFWGGRLIVDDLSISTGTDTTEDWDLSGSKQSGPLTLPIGTTW